MDCILLNLDIECGMIKMLGVMQYLNRVGGTKVSSPSKMKIFIWHSCRNNLPVKNRLRTKEVSIPIMCPMCNNDIEHLLHISLTVIFLLIVGVLWSLALT